MRRSGVIEPISGPWENLGEVMQRISMAELKFSVKKCAIFQKQVKYWGHLVAADGIPTDEDKTRAVNDWPRPQNLHELRSFIGNFVPNFASVGVSLHELTKKSKVCQ